MEDTASCACQVVRYAPIAIGVETFREEWRCVDCDTKFIKRVLAEFRIAELETLLKASTSRVTALEGAYRLIGNTQLPP